MNVYHCPEDVVEIAVKKYSEIAAQSQQKIIEKNFLKHSTKAVAEAVTQKMDSDKIVRDQKKLHLVAGYFTLFGSRGGRCPPLASPRGGILKSRTGIPIFTNNMIFLECGVIALFEAFYMFRDHNHVKMKF